MKFLRAASVSHANKYETEWLNMPHIKVSKGGKGDAWSSPPNPGILAKTPVKMLESKGLRANNMFRMQGQAGG